MDSQPTLNQLLHQFTEGDMHASIAAHIQLMKLGEPAVEPLISIVQNPGKKELWWLAAEAFGLRRGSFKYIRSTFSLNISPFNLNLPPFFADLTLILPHLALLFKLNKPIPNGTAVSKRFCRKKH